MHACGGVCSVSCVSCRHGQSAHSARVSHVCPGCVCVVCMVRGRMHDGFGMAAAECACASHAWAAHAAKRHTTPHHTSAAHTHHAVVCGVRRAPARHHTHHGAIQVPLRAVRRTAARTASNPAPSVHNQNWQPQQHQDLSSIAVAWSTCHRARRRYCAHRLSRRSYARVMVRIAAQAE